MHTALTFALRPAAWPRLPAALLAALLPLLLATPAVQAAADPPGGNLQLETHETPRIETHASAARDLALRARRLPVDGRLVVQGLRLGSDGPGEILELERFAVFTPGARIVVHGEDGDSQIEPPRTAWFRGRLAGDPESVAVLILPHDGDARGLVMRGGEAWVIGEAGEDGVLRETGAATVPGDANPGENASGPTHLVTRRAEAGSGEGSGAAEGFLCGNEGLSLDAPPAPDFLASPTPAALVPTYETAQVAVETDWELYQKFGNTTDATDYVSDLVAYSSSLYDAEIQTELVISHLSLWSTSSDPWTQTNPLCALFEMGRYWNDNNGAVTRTLTHMMSGKGNGGGVAWVGVLCNGAFDYNHGGACPALTPQTDNYGGAYGYSGDMDGNFNAANPQTVWDVVVVSHEIGHNFNSPHTHCYAGIGGSSSPVDECYGGESGCYNGATSLPAGCPGAGQECGTIMSYCHLKSGGLGNIAPTFGTGHPYGVLPYRVPDRMRAHVEALASVSSCLDRINPCDDLVLDSGTVNTTESYTTCANLYANTDFRVGGSGDVTLSAGNKVILGNGFRVDLGGRLTVE